MSTGMSGGLSKTRLGRMHDVMAAHVEAGDMPGLVTPRANNSRVSS
jgi:hypothetical protein